MMLKIPRRQLGWIAAWILFALWFILQLTGWYYAFQARRLERRLSKLRPTLSSIILFDQLESVRRSCLQTFGEIRGLDIRGAAFLEMLSRDVPPSVTLKNIEFHPMLDLSIRGTLTTDGGDPEAVCALLIGRLSSTGKTYRVRQLSPSPERVGLWDFELRSG